jgi:alkylation response protein AidB-like acyl-CoA dehydrogenase
MALGPKQTRALTDEEKALAQTLERALDDKIDMSVCREKGIKLFFCNIEDVKVGEISDAVYWELWRRYTQAGWFAVARYKYWLQLFATAEGLYEVLRKTAQADAENLMGDCD